MKATAGQLHLAHAADGKRALQVPLQGFFERFFGFVDLSPNTAAIRGRLDEVEKIARETGYAAAIGLAFPLTIDVLADWSRSLESRGITLVPVSAMVAYER